MNVHVGSDDVPEDIPLDKVAVDVVFRRSLKVNGVQTYLRKLEELTDFGVDERLASAAFQAFKVDLAKRTDYSRVQLDDLSRHGLHTRHIEKIRFAVIQLDNESPKVGAGRQHGTAGTPEDYEDDFEIDEDNDDDDIVSDGSPPGSGEFYRGNGKELHRKKPRDAVDELYEEVEVDEEEEDDARERDIGGAARQHPRTTTVAATIVPRPGLMSPAAAQTASTAADDATASAGMRGSTASTSLSDKRRKKNSSWIREGRWKRGEAIGKGSFGEVFKAMNDKGKLFAVKQLNMAGKQDEVEDLIHEIETMKELEHPNIVAYVGACVDEDKGFVYIFQEWAPGGSVAHLLKNFGPFDLGTIRSYTRQILHGLVYLHENGIVHRDIKGGNVLVDTGTVKLADFGASTKLDFGQTQNTSTMKGTPYFMAPETISENKYGRKGDIWAVGCTIIQMLTGDPPWKDRNLRDLMQLHVHLMQWTGPPTFSREVPPEVHACLEICFAKDPNKRPSAAELLQCAYLHHAKNVDDLDESTNSLPDHAPGGTGLGGGAFGSATHGRHSTARTADGDDLEDSAVMLKQQISRAVSRASLSVQERAGGVASLGAAKQLGLPSANNPFAKGHAHPGNSNSNSNNNNVDRGGFAGDSSEANDSTIGGIERQILQRQRDKQRQQQQSGGTVGLFTGKPVRTQGSAREHEGSSPSDAVFYPRKASDTLPGGRAGPTHEAQGLPSSSNPFAKGATALTHNAQSPASTRGRVNAADPSTARSSSYSPASQSHSRPQSLSPAVPRSGEPGASRHRDVRAGDGVPGRGIACRDAVHHNDDDDDYSDGDGENDHGDVTDGDRIYRSQPRGPQPAGGSAPPYHRQREHDVPYDHRRHEEQHHQRHQQSLYRRVDDIESTLVYDNMDNDNFDADMDDRRPNMRYSDPPVQPRRESKPGGSDSDRDEKDADRRRDRTPRWTGHGDDKQTDLRGPVPAHGHAVGRLVTRATVEERGVVLPDGGPHRYGPALQKKVAVRNSIGSADVGSGLDGMRVRPHVDPDREEYRTASQGHGQGRHDRAYNYDEGEEPELDIISDVRRTGPDGMRRAATSSAAVRSQAPLAPSSATKRVHTAGAAVHGTRSRGATPSVGSSGVGGGGNRTTSPAAALGRYAPPKTATTARFDSDDDTADEGSGDDANLHYKHQQQQKRATWYCANSACKRANDNPDYFDACEYCATPRSGPFSLVGRRAF